MDGLIATDSAESDATQQVKPKRLDRKSPLPTRGRSYEWRSRKGLLHPLVIDPQCPYCGEVHQYRAAGLRVAACRGGYVEITARKARKPSGGAANDSKCRQATVDSGTVDSVYSSSRPDRGALTSASVPLTASESPLATVDVNSSRGTEVAP